MSNKTERINLRCSPENARILREAAEVQGQDLTSFMVGTAIDRARQILTEHHALFLSPEDVRLLEDALADDSPSAELAALFRKVTRTTPASTAP